VTYKRKEQIGNCTLYLADCMDVLPTLGRVDAVVTDPPYSERCHKGHDAGSAPAQDGANRARLGYSFLSLADVDKLAPMLCAATDAWVVWMTDSDLALAVRTALERCGRYAFAPLPFYHVGRSVRLTGDGPCSWTDYIIVARTKAQVKWGTLPGGYVAGEGWKDKVHMGGKPTKLMQALVGDYSRFGNTILDPFMGSGTTGVACVKMGRSFIGIEREESYFDIALKRIDDAYRQPDMLIEHPKIMKQEILDI